ncbi:hypothetical protein BO83DRAFT_207398 [Aspergillus eucalypticola CBS 122712]|uniref:Uncharacterized protein n=1 Tax=Aspergillus eucalypticola (strain CBS 122712 / IBT 29274) TaxID=1448314 RepID=A0A317UKY3_ASPEC|nr:uncharacterized protein BO83DRAFT_207398 [Aspergillus eucalypticola CBS 122712]PWY62029.1 hypothetical protein BO83DRAFT_207398 [Aspergillus eucalypticola CBS 122712]
MKKAESDKHYSIYQIRGQVHNIITTQQTTWMIYTILLSCFIYVLIQNISRHCRRVI